MIEVFKTVNNELVITDAFEEGVWINMVNPSEEEISRVSSSLNVEMDFLRAALDEEERARIESDEGQTLIVVDTPVVEYEGQLNLYYTIPLAIIILKHTIITVCLYGDTILDDFRHNRVKSFLTQFKTRFVLQVLYRNFGKVFTVPEAYRQDEQQGRAGPAQVHEKQRADPDAEAGKPCVLLHFAEGK